MNILQTLKDNKLSAGLVLAIILFLGGNVAMPDEGMFGGPVSPPGSSSVTVDLGSAFPNRTLQTDGETPTTTSRIGTYNDVFNGSTWSMMRGSLTSNTSSVVGFANSLPFGQVTTSPATLTTGQFAQLSLLENGALRTLADPFWSTTHTQMVSSAVVKASAGTVNSVSCFSNSNTVVYVQLFNTSTVATLATGAPAPTYSYMLPSGAQTLVGNDQFGEGGIRFNTGIALSISGIATSTVAAGINDAICDITYR